MPPHEGRLSSQTCAYKRAHFSIEAGSRDGFRLDVPIYFHAIGITKLYSRTETARWQYDGTITVMMIHVFVRIFCRLGTQVRRKNGLRGAVWPYSRCDGPQISVKFPNLGGWKWGVSLPSRSSGETHAGNFHYSFFIIFYESTNLRITVFLYQYFQEIFWKNRIVVLAAEKYLKWCILTLAIPYKPAYHKISKHVVQITVLPVMILVVIWCTNDKICPAFASRIQAADSQGNPHYCTAIMPQHNCVIVRWRNRAQKHSTSTTCLLSYLATSHTYNS